VPVRWTKPGSLLLKQRAEVVAETQAEVTWRLEAAFDAKKDAMQLLKARELTQEEEEKLSKEIEENRAQQRAGAERTR
jgi:16S rRNA C1402 (ribose-2'-O) methylase RsmI